MSKRRTLYALAPALAMAGTVLAVSSPRSPWRDPRSVPPVDPAVVEGTVARATAVFEEVGRERRSPAVAVLPDGTTLVAYTEYQPAVGDRLVVERSSAEGWQRQEVVAEPCQILDPVLLVDAAGVAHLFWCELRGRNSQLLHARRGEEGFGAPAKVTDRESSHHSPCAVALPDGSVLLAALERWAPTAARERWRMVSIALRGEEVAPPVVVVESANSNVWDPALAVSPSGKTWAGWSVFRGDASEVEVRPLDATGAPAGPVEEISRDPRSDDLHPALAFDECDRLWVAYDASLDPQRRSSVPPPSVRNGVQGATLELRCRDTDGVLRELPRSLLASEPARKAQLGFSWTGGQPVLACDARGIHVLCRVLRRIEYGPKDQAHEYAAVLLRLDGTGWSAPVFFDPSGGADERPAMVRAADRAWCAFQVDRRGAEVFNAIRTPIPPAVKEAIEAKDIYLSGCLGPSAVVLAAVEDPAVPSSVPRDIALEPVPEERPAARADSAAWTQNPICEGTEHWTVRHRKREFQVYWGDLHRHSSVSRCTEGMEMSDSDRYRFVQDVCSLDFVALTDHSGSLDAFQWWHQGKLLDLHTMVGFQPLQGFEWSSMEFGHENVIFAERLDRIVSRHHELCLTRDRLHERIRDWPCLVIPHHPADRDRAYQWPKRDDEKLLQLVEVYQSQRGNYEFPGCFRQASGPFEDSGFVRVGLDQGLRFGLIASSDHGSGASFAGVLSPSPERADLYEALHSRRTFGATTKGMLAVLKVNDVLMGGTVRKAGPLEISIEARGRTEIAQVIVFRDGEVLREFGQAEQPARKPGAFEVVDLETGLGSDHFETTFVDDRPGDKGWIYLRVIQRDGEMAWSSPVFLRQGSGAGD